MDGVCEGHGYEMHPAGVLHGRTLLRHVNGFYDYFKLLSVVKVDGEVTAMSAWHSTAEKEQNVFFLGGSNGKIYVFLPSGHILYEHDTGAIQLILWAPE